MGGVQIEKDRGNPILGNPIRDEGIEKPEK